MHCIRTSQLLPIGIEEAWEFISSPHNLEKITPPGFGFKITNGVKPKDKMYPGQIIVYKVRPVFNIEVEWVTEITQVKFQHYFIDEQRSGPYKIWHHQHFLTPVEGGVRMDDIIHYKVPMGILGKILNSLFVKKKLISVFEHRHVSLEKIFGKI